MSKRQRRRAVLALAAAGALVFTGCTQVSPEPTDPDAGGGQS